MASEVHRARVAALASTKIFLPVQESRFNAPGELRPPPRPFAQRIDRPSEQDAVQ